MKTGIILASLSLVLLIPLHTLAMTDEFDFTGEVAEKDYRDLTAELRCLVCQNESLASSHADLAKDLKREVYDLMREGKNNQEVKDFLVQRYGDFVLYQPPLKRSTLILWFGPFILLGLGGFFLFKLIREKSTQADEPLTPEEQKRLDNLLGENTDAKNKNNGNNQP